MKDIGIYALIGAGLVGAVLYFNRDEKKEKPGKKPVMTSAGVGEAITAMPPSEQVTNSGTEMPKTEIDISKQSDLSPAGKEENQPIPEPSTVPNESIGVKKKTKISY